MLHSLSVKMEQYMEGRLYYQLPVSEIMREVQDEIRYKWSFPLSICKAFNIIVPKKWTECHRWEW